MSASPPASPNSYILNTLDQLEQRILLLDDTAARKRIKNRMEDIITKLHKPKRQRSSNGDDTRHRTKRQRPSTSNEVETRFQEITQDAQDYLDCQDFVMVLTTEVDRSTPGENAAFRRLWQGFSDEKENWRSVLEPLATSCDSWTDRCRKHQLNDALLDQDKQLLHYEETRYHQLTGANIIRYVDHVIQLVETLKFIKRWNKRDRDGEKGSKKWKTQLIQDSFRASSPQNRELWTLLNEKPKDEKQELELALQTFRSEHARRITTYNNLESIYHLFGPGVFLDFFWAPEIGRSKTFRQLLDHMRQNMPVMVKDEDLLLSVYNYARSADSLFQVLTVLAGQEIAKYVQDFMRENPPYLPEESSEFTWGEDVQ